MCKVISVANIKGGVAKTTTAANLGVGLVKKGKRVLLVDLDPQGSLSLGLGIRNNKELPYTVNQMFIDLNILVLKEISYPKEEGGTTSKQVSRKLVPSNCNESAENDMI